MADTDSENTSGSIGWDESLDIMLSKWCDEAKCFEWMHSEAYSYYDKRARIINISTNILISVSGLSNIIAGGTAVNGFQLSWVFGTLSIVISIANMLQEKLAYTSKASEHIHYSAQWDSIRRRIEEVISMPPEARKDCRTFLKYLRQDINAVSVGKNMMIPDFIRIACHDKFNMIVNFDIPDICGKMEHTRPYMRNISSDSIVSVKPLNDNKVALLNNHKKYVYPTHNSVNNTPLPNQIDIDKPNVKS
jgi:hypothetical protein